MTSGRTQSLDRFQAPFGKQVELLEVTLEDGVRLLQVRIREGSRFTILDLDPVTASRWAAGMDAWAAAYPAAEGGVGVDLGDGPADP